MKIVHMMLQTYILLVTIYTNDTSRGFEKLFSCVIFITNIAMKLTVTEDENYPNVASDFFLM
jgi:hypothetical protein